MCDGEEGRGKEMEDELDWIDVMLRRNRKREIVGPGSFPQERPDHAKPVNAPALPGLRGR